LEDNLTEDRQPYELSRPAETDNPVEHFNRAVRWFMKEADEKIVRDYEQNENPDNNLSYHDHEHTEDVVNLANKIIKNLDFENDSDRHHTAGLAVIAAAMHDIHKSWHEKQVADSNGNIRMVRADGIDPKNGEPSTDEDESALVAKSLMQKYNIDNGQIFSQDEIDTVVEAIRSSKTTMDSDYVIHHPQITAESPLIARVLALADIGRAGYHPGSFLGDGDKLFVEQNLDVSRRLREVKDTPLAEAEQRMFAWRILDWSFTQIKIAQGLKDHLIDEVCDGLTDQQKTDISSVLSHFDQSIESARIQYNQRFVIYQNGDYAELIDSVY
jgi:HD superfamily phosphohydrolase YqeK